MRECHEGVPRMNCTNYGTATMDTAPACADGPSRHWPSAHLLRATGGSFTAPFQHNFTEFLVNPSPNPLITPFPSQYTPEVIHRTGLRTPPTFA